MTETQFNEVALMHRQREAFKRIIEAMSGEMPKYGMTISAQDLETIGVAIHGFAVSQVQDINEKVKKL